MDNLRGILLLIMAMAAFSIEDAFVKAMSEHVSVAQILIMLGIGSSVIFGVLAWHQGHALFSRIAWQPLCIWRALAEAGAALTFVTAISLIDLSVLASVFQATPLVVTMGAALFLGETVGWRRWSAICVGFAGVLLIIRPGLEGFEPIVLIVLITVVFIAVRDLVTRRIDVNVPSTVVSFQGFAALIFAGALLLIFTDQGVVSLTSQLWWMLVGGVIFGALGYYGIVVSMRIADASAIMPFRYTRLLFTLLIAMIVFGERPDLLTLFGGSIVIASGFYTYVRERRLSQSN